MDVGTGTKLGKILVRSVAREDSLSLTLVLKGKLHRLLRPKEESLGKTLRRISLTANKTEKSSAKVRKKNTEPTASEVPCPIEACLYCGESEVSSQVPNSRAWVDGNVLVISDAKFAVTVNPPAATSLRVPDCAMSGYPIIPQVQLEFADFSSCAWTWRRYSPVSEIEATAAAFSTSSENSHPHPDAATYQDPTPIPMNTQEIEALQVLSKSFIYWPLEEDCGSHLLLKCLPANSEGRLGQPAFVLTKKVVPGPSSSSPVTRRHLLTATHLSAPDQFRVVSYNILADPYASSNFAREVLYPYCKPEALNVEYRQCLVVSELLGYHADVVCLQEVGSKMFNQFLLPALQERCYGGCFQPKSGQELMRGFAAHKLLIIQTAAEGEAIFFNANKFALVSSERTSLSEFLQTHPSCSSLYQGLKAAPTVLKDLTTKHTIVQLAFLRCLQRPDHFLCIANTHLYFHPMGDHIRLLQVDVSLKVIRNALDAFKQTVGPRSTVAVLFCGDFNSCPCIAAYHYMLTGSVSKQHPDWMVYKLTEIPRCACNHKPLAVGAEGELEDGTEQASVWPVCSQVAVDDSFEGLDLHHGFQFQNATGTVGYTNFTSGYRGVLDYVFFDADNLSVERTIPLPSLEEISEFVALPSVYFPSDHLALVTDLKWNS